MLHPDRYFDPEPSTRGIARSLYERVASLPLVCPHGHVDPRMLAENAPFPDPSTLIVTPDHYIFRMLYSQGIPLESLGIPRAHGGAVETDPRNIWQVFAAKFYLFAGTPTGCWLKQELSDVFGIDEPLNAGTGMRIYDALSAKLQQPEFLPRALFDQFNIEVLCTTDAATDTLEHHQQILDSGWKAKILPTFRPDRAIDVLYSGWKQEIQKLGQLTRQEITGRKQYIRAMEERRGFFRSMGAKATDHAALTPFTGELSASDADAIFQQALRGQATEDQARLFTGHMLMEMARMSVEDGLVMQLHAGSFRNHNECIFSQFGWDKGSDIPVATEWTRNLRPLLNKYGNERDFRLVLFTLDESTYSRELAPLAGHYPALRLGPPWWFQDSIQGMTRFRERVTETAGFYNTAGFNDDTRAFPSIPARHDLARRVDANFLARQVGLHVIEMEEAEQIIEDLAYNLAKQTYKLDRA